MESVERKNIYRKSVALMQIVFFLCGAILTPNAIASNSTFETEQQPSDSIEPRINHEMLRMFEDFKARGTITESFYYRLIQASENNDAERWQQLLQEYRGAIEAGEDPFEQEEFIELAEDELEDFEQEEIPTGPVSEKVNGAENANTEIAEEEFPVEIIRNTSIEQPSSFPSSPGIQDIVQYHVQIAASTVPLEDDYLRRIYRGDLEISHFSEDNWEKYYIGHFQRFADAREQLRNTHVEGAFVIAFIAGTKVLPYKARMVERVFTETRLNLFHNQPGDQFRVQLAASRRPLRPTEIEKLYHDISQIGIIYEEDWFKYSIPGAESLNDSWIIARSLNVEGAFVVRYLNGKKAPLRR